MGNRRLARWAPRRWAPRLALLLTSLAISWVLVEVVARLTSEAPEWGSAPAVPPELADAKVYETVFQLLQRNAKGLHKGLPYRTNSAGMRGAEVALEKPGGVFRIAVIGDSITMGSGVLEHQPYPVLLEGLLTAEYEVPQFEVLNLGISGLNLQMSVGRLEAVGHPFQPDLVVYGFTENDLRGRHYRKSAVDVSWRVENPEPGEVTFEAPRFLRSRFYSLLELVAPPEGSYVRELDDNYFDNPEAWKFFEDAMTRLARYGLENDVCIMMLVHTDLHFLHFLHPMRRHYLAAEQAATQRGIAVQQSFEYFRGRDAPSLWVSPHDFHPNPEGHAVLARALLDGLEALPEQCWPPASARPRAGPATQ
jgi:lysophospholipase L1-like esterase